MTDKYELYLDYQLIVQTASAEAALSILLALYNIFEIKFQRHYRGIHLLYGVIFEDNNELSKSFRKDLLSWGYTIKTKSVVHQHKRTTTTTTTTTMNNINTTENAPSVEPNVNDLSLLTQTVLIQNQALNDANEEPALNRSSQESSKCPKKTTK